MKNEVERDPESEPNQKLLYDKRFVNTFDSEPVREGKERGND